MQTAAARLDAYIATAITAAPGTLDTTPRGMHKLILGTIRRARQLQVESYQRPLVVQTLDSLKSYYPQRQEA